MIHWGSQYPGRTNMQRKKRNNMKLKFNKELYKKNTILKSIKAYNKIIKLKFHEDKDYFILSSEQVDNEELIKNEISNYILFNTR